MLRRLMTLSLSFLLVASINAYGFSIPDDYNPDIKDCYKLARAHQYYNIAKRTKQEIAGVSKYIQENYFQDNREVYYFFLQPNLSRYHKRYEFIVEPMKKYAQCIVEIKHSNYTLESCFKMMYLKDLVWSYKAIRANKEQIHDVLRDQLGRAYAFIENQAKRFVHLPKKKFLAYMKKDFEQCLLNRKEEIVKAKVVEVEAADRLIVQHEDERLVVSLMGMRATKNKRIEKMAVKYLQEQLLNKKVKVRYHTEAERGNVAIIELEGKLVGEWLIERGFSKYARQDFDSSFFFTKDSYARASANAKLKKVGVWSRKK